MGMAPAKPETIKQLETIVCPMMTSTMTHQTLSGKFDGAQTSEPQQEPRLQNGVARTPPWALLWPSPNKQKHKQQSMDAVAHMALMPIKIKERQEKTNMSSHNKTNEDISVYLTSSGQNTLLGWLLCCAPTWAMHTIRLSRPRK